MRMQYPHKVKSIFDVSANGHLEVFNMNFNNKKVTYLPSGGVEKYSLPSDEVYNTTTTASYIRTCIYLKQINSKAD